MKGSEEVYKVLKDEIQYLVRKPGSSIDDLDLSQRFGVSRTPVREALLRLSAEGLINIFPQRGTFVSFINFEYAMEAAYMRHLLDTNINVKLCREKARVSDAVAEALYFMSAAVRKNDAISFVKQDDCFHRALFEIAGHRVMWDILEEAQAHNNRVRMLDIQRPDTMIPSLQEHRKIAQYIEGGEEFKLREILKHHHDINSIQERKILLSQIYPGFFSVA